MDIQTKTFYSLNLLPQMNPQLLLRPFIHSPGSVHVTKNKTAPTLLPLRLELPAPLSSLRTAVFLIFSGVRSSWLVIKSASQRSPELLNQLRTRHPVSSSIELFPTALRAFCDGHHVSLRWTNPDPIGYQPFWQPSEQVKFLWRFRFQY